MTKSLAKKFHRPAEFALAVLGGKWKTVISLSRRGLLLSAAALGTILSIGGYAADRRTLRVGYQKGGGLLGLLKAQGTLENKLAPMGWELIWSEFPAGPQLLEAMNTGSLDFGYTGAPPPIFSQAAGNDIVYVGAEPIGPSTEGVIVKARSPVTSIRALKGRSVAVQKGSSAYYMLLEALNAGGLVLADIEPVYLAPAYGRAAFEADRVDAWTIWDPYLASVQAAVDVRVLADYRNLPETFSYYLAARVFADQSASLVLSLLEELAAAGAWAVAHPDAAAQVLSPQLGLPLAVVEAWQRRARYGVRVVDPAVVASQQKVADAFFQQRLIPQKIDIAKFVWRRPGG